MSTQDFDGGASPCKSGRGFSGSDSAALTRAWVAVGLVNHKNNRINSNLALTKVQPPCNIKPSRIRPAPIVSVMPAACAGGCRNPAAQQADATNDHEKHATEQR